LVEDFVVNDFITGGMVYYYTMNVLINVWGKFEIDDYTWITHMQYCILDR